MKVILGRKLKMDQIWNNDKVVPVTLIEAGPCQVTQIKTKEKDVNINLTRIISYIKFRMKYEICNLSLQNLLRNLNY